MIVKEREKPIRLQKLEALIRRTPHAHPKYQQINEQLARSIAGYKGEQSLDYYLDLLPEKKYAILHNVRLPHKNSFFQMDTLLLSPSLILILEVKNMMGTLFFDPVFHQLIRTKDEQEEGFPDPFLQIQRQKEQLKTWLTKQKIPRVPIEALIVISNSNSVIRTAETNQSISKTLIRKEFLPFKIAQLETEYRNEALSPKQFLKLSRQLKKSHTPENPAILSQFQMTPEQLKKGIFCPSCDTLPLRRKLATWYCPSCKDKHKFAHIPAIYDYSLLIKREITNKEARDFWLLTDPHVAKRLLQAMGLPSTGAGRARIYTIC
ncbi:nuclease-related domain-containing protein [Halalkalibacter urbisdiaboli]|uniref:nuclease-related domain-containing protein n=1 Tax=Halalkalibacter urbisdiaboli TaxID=1960589 RepID=UPI0013FD6C7D|nr:nuclease-related domain-containing protein [Halalkalibacter urbisdiaboli]